jgi:heme-degrading monooxygenase HmoA
MSVVKINAISVPEGGGPELEKRFASRAGAVENQPGFEEFQLLRPVEGEDRYFVYTRWDSEESFQAWVNSQAFAHGHTGAGGPPAGGPLGGPPPGGPEGRPHGGPPPGGPEGGPHGGPPAHGGPHGGPQGGEPPKPVSTGASLLAFEVVQLVSKPAADAAE